MKNISLKNKLKSLSVNKFKSYSLICCSEGCKIKTEYLGKLMKNLFTLLLITYYFKDREFLLYVCDIV